MPQKTINIVCSYFPPHRGGIERFADIQSREMSALGFKVNVITHNTERTVAYERRGSVDVYRVRCIGFLKDKRLPFPGSIADLYRVYRRCFTRDAVLTVVHARYYLLSLIGCLFARMSGTTLVLVDHSSDYISLKGNLLNATAHVYERLMTSLIRLSRPKVFGVAAACNHWLQTLGIRPSGICYNGIDLSSKEALLPDIRAMHKLAGRRVILYVGRLIEEKGVSELVEGFRKFAQGRTDYALIVIGYGELEPALEKAAAESDSIIFLGKQPPEIVLGYMKQADILVNPSNYPEGLPTILLEAGRYGLVIISTGNGGASEVVVDDETGIVLERGEAQMIVRALSRVDADYETARDLGLRLQETVCARFSFREITRKFLLEDLALVP